MAFTTHVTINNNSPMPRITNGNQWFSGMYTLLVVSWREMKMVKEEIDDTRLYDTTTEFVLIFCHIKEATARSQFCLQETPPKKCCTFMTTDIMINNKRRPESVWTRARSFSFMRMHLLVSPFRRCVWSIDIDYSFPVYTTQDGTRRLKASTIFCGCWTTPLPFHTQLTIYP